MIAGEDKGVRMGGRSVCPHDAGWQLGIVAVRESHETACWTVPTATLQSRAPHLSTWFCRPVDANMFSGDAMRCYAIAPPARPSSAHEQVAGVSKRSRHPPDDGRKKRRKGGNWGPKIVAGRAEGLEPQFPQPKPTDQDSSDRQLQYYTGVV